MSAPGDRIAFFGSIDTSDREVAAEVLSRWLAGCGLTGELRRSGAELVYADGFTYVFCHPAESNPGAAPYYLLEGYFFATASGPNLRLSALAPLCRAAGLGAGVEYVQADGDRPD
jgi:hypothetical protein